MYLAAVGRKRALMPGYRRKWLKIPEVSRQFSYVITGSMWFYIKLILVLRLTDVNGANHAMTNLVSISSMHHHYCHFQ